MARKLPGLRRELDARSLFSVAYGEIASSIYFALGVIALHALGFTPLVLLGVGLLFLLVALSYAEATSALPETGGAATFVRRAFERPRRLHDRLGALPRLPDRDRALGALRAALPRRGAPGATRSTATRGTSSSASARSSSSRRSGSCAGRRSTRVGIVVPALDLLDPARARRARLRPPLLAARAHARHVARPCPDRGTRSPSRVPLAMLAYTGLETVANLAEEARRPGVDLPRSLFVAIGTVVTVVRRDRRRRALGVPGPGHRARHRWLRAPLVGVAERDRRRAAGAARRHRSASSSARAAR